VLGEALVQVLVASLRDQDPALDRLPWRRGRHFGLWRLCRQSCISLAEQGRSAACCFTGSLRLRNPAIYSLLQNGFWILVIHG